MKNRKSLFDIRKRNNGATVPSLRGRSDAIQQNSCSANWVRMGALLLLISIAFSVAAGQSTTSSSTPIVPSLINFSGYLNGPDGKPLTTLTGVTFLLYAESQGGAPLWMETQNVRPNRTGHYTVALGSTSSQGLPMSVFASGEARWLGVQVQGQEEQARVMLLAVPYALKAADAETVGGLPPSAFVLSLPPGAAVQTPDVPPAESRTGVAPPLSGTGTTNYLPLWTNTTTLGSSVLFQSGTGTTAKLGINTATPATPLDVKGAATVRGNLSLPATGTATNTAGKTSQPVTMTASVFNSSSTTAVNENFRWQAEPVGNNTTGATGSLNLLWAQGTGAYAETGLKFGPNGIVTFASGQTFPGTGNGTITAVSPGTALTGGGTSGAVTLNVDTAKVPLLSAASNNFTGNLTVAGSLGIATAAPSVKLDVSSGDAIVRGVGNFSQTGQVANFYIGDTYHDLQTSFGGGLNISTYLVPSALFIRDGNGHVSIGYPGDAGPQLFVQGNSTVSGISVNGANATSVSGSNGAPGIIAQGGDGNLAFDTISRGGDGIDAYGGGAWYLDAVGGSFSGGQNGGDGDGIDAYAGSGMAGAFNGDVAVYGTLYKTSGAFKIDHPLDPANKYLYHSFVESPDMMNIYNGNIVTDSQGDAVIPLPEWFEALNRDFRYQLTVIGQFAQAIVTSEVANHQFSIKTDKPAVKVSWQVTGIRRDAWANAHRIPLEEEKNARERGHYIHPELFGAPEESSIAWARHPEAMKLIKEIRQAQSHTPPSSSARQSGLTNP